MDLQRQLLLRIEQFDQQRKTWRSEGPAKNFFAKVDPKIVKRSARERTITHDTLGLRPIDDLPRFADSFVGRQSLAEQRGKVTTTPNPFLENRFEVER